jgi:hypothetical protein
MFIVFFLANATHGYWAIPMRRGDEYKVAIIAPNRQWLFQRIGQGLKEAAYTYAQLSDLVFSPLLKTDEELLFPTLIKDYRDAVFILFIDNYIGAATDFWTMYTFLYKKYFPRIIFSLLSLNPKKLYFFYSTLKVIGFSVNREGLRPTTKYRNQIVIWPILKTRQELNDFI